MTTEREPPVWRRQIRVPRLRREDARSILGLIALVALLFREAIFEGRVFYERDVHIVWHQQYAVFFRSFLAGSWPVWDPYIAFGQPFLANPNSQVLYPMTWLGLLLQPWTYYTVFIVSHLIFAAVGLYFLARRFAVSALGAFTAAALWTLSGPLLSMVNVWHHFGGATWLPWVVLSAEAALQNPNVARTLVWGAATAGQVLVGSPDLCVFTNLVVLVLFAVRSRPWGWAGMAQRLWTLVGAWTVGLALSAPQWLPSLELALQSSRADLPSKVRTFWSAHPLSFLQLLIPVSFSELPNHLSDSNVPHDLWQPFLASVYLGAPAAGLVLSALIGPRRTMRGVLVAVAATALALALGRHSPIYGLATLFVWPLRLVRYPIKITILAAFAWALLVGMGLDAWRRTSDVNRTRRRGLFMGLILIAALTWIAWHVGRNVGMVGTHEGRWAIVRAILSTAPARIALTAGLTTIVALLAAFGLGNQRRGVWVGPLVALVAIADLMIGHRGLNPTIGSDFYRYRPEILSVIKPQDLARVYVWDYVLRVPGRGHDVTGMVALFYQMPSEWSPSVGSSLAMQMYLYPPSAGRWGLYGSYDGDTLELFPRHMRDATLLLRGVEDTPAFRRLLQIGGVDYVVSLHTEGMEDLDPIQTLPGLYKKPIQVLRVPGRAPRTFVVGGTRGADGEAALRLLLDPDFDPTREIVLPETWTRPAPGGFSGRSRILSHTPDRVKIECTLSHPGYVVLVDAHDPGWRVTIDGRPAEAQRANVIFRAVAVPAGTHAIEWLYRPRSLIVGLGVAFVTVLAALTFVLCAALRRKG